MTAITPPSLLARWAGVIPSFGYGRCYRCLRPWWCATWHEVPTGDHSGCFALCEPCWSKTDTLQRLVAYRRLMDTWLLDGADVDTVDQRWAAASAHIAAAKEDRP